MKLNTGLKRVKSGRGAISYLGCSYIWLTEEFNTCLSELVLKIVLEVISDLWDRKLQNVISKHSL